MLSGTFIKSMLDYSSSYIDFTILSISIFWVISAFLPEATFVIQRLCELIGCKISRTRKIFQKNVREKRHRYVRKKSSCLFQYVLGNESVVTTNTFFILSCRKKKIHHFESKKIWSRYRTLKHILEAYIYMLFFYSFSF